MGWWEETVFYWNGHNRYSKRGFDCAYSKFDVRALELNLTGKVYIVTGANSGIGKVVARELGARGAIVHMVCRNQAKADVAAAELATATQKPVGVNFITHVVDLSRPQEIKRFARDFASKNNQLDALINNAGCMVDTRMVTPDGLESTFACNVLGTYILTECLLPTLQKTPGSRVVTVSSAGMLTEKLDVVDPQSMIKYNGLKAYARQKRAQVELTHHWANVYPGIQFLSMHPGWVDTPGVQTSMPSFYRNNRNRLRTPEQGADTVLWCAATAVAMQLPNGSFVEDRKRVDEHVLWGRTATVQGDLDRLVAYLNGLSAQFPADGSLPTQPIVVAQPQAVPPVDPAVQPQPTAADPQPTPAAPQPGVVVPPPVPVVPQPGPVAQVQPAIPENQQVIELNDSKEVIKPQNQ